MNFSNRITDTNIMFSWAQLEKWNKLKFVRSVGNCNEYYISFYGFSYIMCIFVFKIFHKRMKIRITTTARYSVNEIQNVSCNVIYSYKFSTYF